MRKQEEISNPTSCSNQAGEQEMMFVLLGRDVAAPAAIRYWVAERIRLHKNLPEDPQIQSALETARIMEAERVA